MKDSCALDPKMTDFFIPQNLTTSVVDKQNILDFYQNTVINVLKDADSIHAAMHDPSNLGYL
jgi:hypothetical protein